MAPWSPSHIFSYYCQDDLWVRLTSRLNQHPHPYRLECSSPSIVHFPLPSIPAQAFTSHPSALSSQASSSNKPLTACLLPTPQWVKCPSGLPHSCYLYLRTYTLNCHIHFYVSPSTTKHKLNRGPVLCLTCLTISNTYQNTLAHSTE